ncbi:MAG: enoyl-CoA hydratase/isomerase family protein [Rhodoplanes sp.]|uniref:enoyl-CoA hydratase-related protein n=1 Tax=Rhodoplanes sp. TaxID=1968906 RepID=UPI0017EB83AA|nr:enoyl-CoA hydratase-related protein [Rhodoplanes sp.]NVO17608.1 enoyl-CoA hydratase/isomerase family protein [Rhodoplanes sp.]
MAERSFTVAIDPDGIAVVTWDMPGRSMNVIDFDVIDELSAILVRVTADPAVRGTVLCSGKETFCAGGDLVMVEAFGRGLDALVLREGAEAAARRVLADGRRLSGLARRIETSGKPWVVAIDGTALGGGFELSLGCHRRIAADHTRTRVGVPEVRIGLFPGAGGTQRIARLTPLADALALMLSGDHIGIERARALRLIDDIVPPSDLITSAKAWILSGGSAVAPWDRPGFRPPGEPLWSSAGSAAFAAEVARCRRDTANNYPAARAILQAVYEGLQLPMDLALDVEARLFAAVLRTPEAVALMSVRFVSVQELNKGARRPPGVPHRAMRTIGVVGADCTGAGIAQAAVQAGLDVVPIDTGREGDDAAAGWERLAGCDLVVAAVGQDRRAAAALLTRIDAAAGPDTMLALTCSTLAIDELATGCREPARVLGLHVGPAEDTPLVEIVAGLKTGATALAAAFDLVRALRKTPIMVAGAPYTPRLAMRYLGEGRQLLAEGVPKAVIETAARCAGMAVGPLALAERLGPTGAVGSEPAGGGRPAPRRSWHRPGPADITEIAQRLLAVQVLEAVRCVEEGVVTDVREADVAAVLGLGFPSFTGGPLSWIDHMGTAAFAALCRRLAAKDGPRFAPGALLTEMAAGDDRFYHRFAPPRFRRTAAQGALRAGA